MGADHDSRPARAGFADRALQVIAAERHADAIVQSVLAGELDAEGLAIAIAPLYGAGLDALARALVKALPRTP